MRRYTQYATKDVCNLLNKLADISTPIEAYQDTMYRLGRNLAGEILSTLNKTEPDAEICIACTVEDADFLAKGIIDVLEDEQRFQAVRFACFWNERLTPFGVKEASIAPILKKYREPFQSDNQYLVVVKSIISGACVVKTNLTNLIEDSDPRKILIVAPVILEGADQRLAAEFSSSIISRFEYRFYAIDDQKGENDNVIPGIGGSVYERLGFGSQQEKNRIVPQLVKTRREQLAPTRLAATA